MTKVTRLNTSAPRRISETIYTDRGLRLGPLQRAHDSGWFWPLMATVPIAAFVAVLFW